MEAGHVTYKSSQIKYLPPGTLRRVFMVCRVSGVDDVLWFCGKTGVTSGHSVIDMGLTLIYRCSQRYGGASM